MLSVFNVPTLILTSALHSFISENFKKRLGLNYNNDIEELEVSISPGDTIKIKNMVRGVKLTLSGQELEVDLHVIEIKNLDVILGIDWLAKNHEIIRWFE